MPLPPLLLPLLPPFTKLDRILESLFIHCKEPIKYTSNRFTFSGMKRERKKRERGRKIHCLFYVSVLFHCKMIHSLQRTDQIYIKSIHIFSVSFLHPDDLKYGHSGLYQTRSLEFATDLRVGQYIDGKLFQKHFELSKLGKSSASASRSKGVLDIEA